MTAPDLTSLPDSLRPLVDAHWRAFVDSGQSLPEILQPNLARVWAGSDYVAEQMIRRPDLVQWLAQPGRLQGRLNEHELRQSLNAALADVNDEADLQQRLRFMRHCHMARIIWRDLTGPRGQSVYPDTVHDLSLLADCLIDAALAVLHRWATERDGVPTGEDGEPVQLTVLAMGK